VKGLLLLASFALATTTAAAAQDGSLEAYLRRLRIEREALHAQLREPVRELVDRLEQLDDPTRGELERVRQEIDGLGPEAGPILVPYIDPGPGPDGDESSPEGHELRAREITDALIRLRAPGIVGDLIRRTATGTAVGRIHAIEILGSSPEPERAGAHLEELFRTSTGKLRLEVVRSLARLGGTRNAPTLRAALTDSDPDVVGTVLAVLAAAHSIDAAPAVLNLTKLSDAAAPVSSGIVAYYLACPEVVDEEVLSALVGLALSADLELERRIEVLDAIPSFEAAKGSRLRRQLDPILDTSVTALREAGLICLASLGDRSARRDLLRAYDDLVQKNGDWPDAYEHRADIQLRIGNYNEAVKDYRRAIELLSSRARQGAYRKLWISMARAYVKGQKLRQAHDTLEEIGLSDKLKAELAADPDFSPLLEHSRYRKILE